MKPRKTLKFPSMLFQFLESFFASDANPQALTALLQYLSVSTTDFHDPDFQFDGEQVFKMLDLLGKYVTDEPPALRVLRHLSVHNMGMAGVAGLTAMTLNDALDIAMRVYKSLMPAIEIDLSENAHTYQLVVVLLADFNHCNTLFMEIIIGALKQFSDEITGEKLHLKLTFSHWPSWGSDREATAQRYRDYFGCEVEFGAQHASLCLTTDALIRRLKSPNRILHSYAKDIAFHDAQQQNTVSSLSDKIRKLLSDAVANEAPLTLVEIANALHMTPRTLSRKLAKENMHYKDLLNEVRFEQAKHLLKHSDIPLKKLAAKLGFASTDAFTRAFKSYTGSTPSQWKSLQ